MTGPWKIGLAEKNKQLYRYKQLKRKDIILLHDLKGEGQSAFFKPWQLA